MVVPNQTSLFVQTSVKQSSEITSIGNCLRLSVQRVTWNLSLEMRSQVLFTFFLSFPFSDQLSSADSGLATSVSLNLMGWRYCLTRSWWVTRLAAKLAGTDKQTRPNSRHSTASHLSLPVVLLYRTAQADKSVVSVISLSCRRFNLLCCFLKIGVRVYYPWSLDSSWA